MNQDFLNSLMSVDLNQWLALITAPTFKTFQLILVIYGGLLWLSIIIWVTRDAIQRSTSLLFQVAAILLNILFPILGILLYLIIRPSKTTLERYYEDLEHRLILESIHEKGKDPINEAQPIKSLHRKPHRKAHKKTEKNTEQIPENVNPDLNSDQTSNP